jgi:hypothetical protein
MNNNHTSQQKFFNALTNDKFNELLKRADETTSKKVLQTHINHRLEEPLRAHIVTSDCVIKRYHDIIIEYYNKDTYLGHFTIHCKVDDTTLSFTQRKQGRLHFKNQHGTCYTMKCKNRKIKNANSSVNIYYETWQYTNPVLKKCINATLDVLNGYMDFNSDLSLDIPMTDYNADKHHCFKIIANKFGKTYKTAIKNTQRQSAQSKRLQKPSKSKSKSVYIISHTESS